jgi:hypothetical protein
LSENDKQEYVVVETNESTKRKKKFRFVWPEALKRDFIASVFDIGNLSFLYK